MPPASGATTAWIGIYENNDPNERLQVIINHSIDLANEGYELGVNYVVYALTH